MTLCFREGSARVSFLGTGGSSFVLCALDVFLDVRPMLAHHLFVIVAEVTLDVFDIDFFLFLCLKLIGFADKLLLLLCC